MTRDREDHDLDRKDRRRSRTLKSARMSIAVVIRIGLKLDFGRESGI
jgi:hypothetical protein